MSSGPACVRRRGAALLLGGIACVLTPVPANTQNLARADSLPAHERVDPETVPRPVAHAHRAPGPVTIDAVLDEPFWNEAEITTGFVQAKPNTGFPASERTVIRILFDDEYLYVGAILYEKDPRDITLHSLKRDFPPADGDVLGIALDTYLDHRNAFLFGVNAGGALIDLQTFDNGRDINIPWDGIVQRAARVHEEGWTVEIAIPFSTLRFDPGRQDQTWGVKLPSAHPSPGRRQLLGALRPTLQPQSDGRSRHTRRTVGVERRPEPSGQALCPGRSISGRCAGR